MNGLYDACQRRLRALAHADRLTEAVQLDMAAAGWVPTVDSYLGRVTKARIVQAVREARGEQAAQAIASLKKGDMAERAAELLTGAGWLPEPLRTPGQVVASVISPILDNTEGVPVDGGAWEASTEEVGAPVEADPGDEPGAVHPNNAEAANAALPDEAWQDAAE